MRRIVFSALFAGLLGCLAVLALAGKGRPPNIILISLDTLRADRLGVYGYGRATSPSFDRWAKDSALFRKAISVSNWTLPAHVSMFTGLYPSSHKVVGLDHKPAGEIALLSEILERAGYETMAFTGGGYLSRGFGMHRGFNHFDPSRSNTDLEGALRRAAKMIAKLDGERPYYALIHAYDLHCPYDVPQEIEVRFESSGTEQIDPRGCGHTDSQISKAQALFLSDRYDERIRLVDDLLGRFFDFLESRSAFADTVLVITSDHGEAFLEHGKVGHSHSLYSELLHIPLAIRAPGIAGREIGSVTSNVDLLPTLLDLAGLPIPQGLDGESLLPVLLRGDGAAKRSFAFSELDLGQVLRSSFGPRYHVIYDMKKGQGSMFEPRIDPLESRDLSVEEGSIFRSLARELLSALPPSKYIEIEPKSIEPLPETDGA